MAGNPAPPSSQSSSATLSPLPPSSPKSGRGYYWTTVLCAILLAIAVTIVGLDFYRIPGIDPVRAWGWHFAISLLILTPAVITIWAMSCGVVAILRSLGARRWHGLAQAVPAVAVVLTLLYFLVRWLFSGPDVA